MNREIIEQHNNLADQGIYSFWLKMNEFGDLTNKEFVMRYNGYRMDLKKSTDRKVFSYDPYNDVPDAIGKFWISKPFGYCWALNLEFGFKETFQG